MNRFLHKLIGLFFCLSVAAFPAHATDADTTIKSANIKSYNSDNGGLQLPEGFSSTIFADGLGRSRHIAVNSNGDVYVKLDKLKDGHGIIRLRDTNGDGKADGTKGFGNYTGTGIAIKNGYLYASSNTTVYRYKLDSKQEVLDAAKPQTIISGLVDKGEHNSKSITLDNAGNIYVNIGAPSNACQLEDRTKGSPGQDPCPILEYGGGIWQFKADKTGQSYKTGVHYASGIRNTVGLDWNSTLNKLFVMQHGRDQLHDLFPELYSDTASAELPAEEFLEVNKGDNFGWPYCYYDEFQNKKLLNPEFGGDAKKQGRCADVKTPIMAFPGHWAPDGLLFYTGNKFPERYKNGAFIAFHGSWNRAPMKQGGYFVAFVPFKDGKPSGPWEPFAQGFAPGSPNAVEGRVLHRPCGLAQGPDGSLYISDDQGGTIWKVTYNGK